MVVCCVTPETGAQQRDVHFTGVKKNPFLYICAADTHGINYIVSVSKLDASWNDLITL